ncbi:MAG: hypothetical protein HY617_00210 [Candidatus Sungbacteria bacterium]|nr:hypothetical protein [Candidatus Sungbacteria bacterium]
MQLTYKKFIVIIVVLVLISFSFAGSARAQGLLDYGGHTLIFIPCTAMATWNLVYYLPTGITSVFALMYSTAKVPQNDDDKNHLIPGFPLLGLAAPATIPCLVYAGVTVVTIGVGFPVVD